MLARRTNSSNELFQRHCESELFRIYMILLRVCEKLKYILEIHLTVLAQ